MAFQEDPPAGVPDWVLTFGDMMSLLLTFFIMLVSMSELKSENRVAMAVEAMKQQFGRDKNTTKGAQRLRGPKVNAPAGDKPQVRGIRPGAEIMVGGAIPFAETSAELTDAEKEAFKQTLQELLGKPQKIEVRGHASRRPLSEDGPLATPWDLAYARARAVMDFLVAEGVPSKRIRLTVAGSNEPAQLATDGKKSPNSRVEVFLVTEFAEDLEGAAEERADRLKTPVNAAGSKPSTVAEPVRN